MDNDCDSATAGDCGTYGLLSLMDADSAWTGPSPLERVGAAVAGVGDTDGDGTDDWLVGVPDSWDTSGAVGRVYMVRAEGWTTGDLDSLAGASWFGAPGTDGGAEGSGVVYLVTAAGSGPSPVADARASLSGLDLAGRLGHSLSPAGDADDDGLLEQAIGAPLHGHQAADSGLVALVLGGQTGVLDLADADARVRGLQVGDYLGTSVAFADLDGDGLDDLVVGAPGESSADAGAGAVGVFAQPTGELFLSDAYALRQGAEAFGLAGTALDAGGDYNGDGAPGLVVGSSFRPVDVGTAGSSYVLLGPLEGSALITRAEVRIWGDGDGDGDGSSVALTGDQDGDGWGELLIGAPGGAKVYGVGGGAGQ